MSILTGFKKYKNYKTDANGDHQLQSFWTSTDTVHGTDQNQTPLTTTLENMNTPTFSEASTRANLAGSNESMTTILGKIKKYFTDLGTAAFKNTTNTYSSTGTDPITGTGVADALDSLDVAEVGGSGKYLTTISEANGKISATADTADTTVTQSSSKLVTSGAVWTAIDNLPEPMVFKGTLGTGGTITTLPVDGTANVGDTYKVITDGTYASIAAKTGDTFICLTQTSSANTWELVPSGDEPSGTVTNVATSDGIITASGSAITTTGTIKANLRSFTKLTNDSAAATETSGRVYPVALDKTGYLSVNVPWTDTDTKMRLYRQNTSYNNDYPLIASRTLASSIGTAGTNSSYSAVYGVMWDDTTKVPTLNPSTGEIKAVKFTGAFNGTATTATKLGSSDVGSATNPMYLAAGVPTACTYSLNKTVPSDAVFTDTKVTVTNTNPTSITTHYPVWYTATSGTGGVGANDGFKYNTLQGTASAVGYANLDLGNSTSTGTAGNKAGTLSLYSEKSGYVSLRATASSTSARAIYFPDKAGTVALTSDITDSKVTSSSNHYSPSTASGQDKTASATGATAAWSIDVVKGITLNTDGKGHVTGLSVTSGKIPANPNTDTKNTAGADNTTSKIFLVGPTAQTTSNGSARTYSNVNCYASGGKLYSNGEEVVTLTASQALTNKTYNGYTLKAACAKSVVTTADDMEFPGYLPTTEAVTGYLNSNNYRKIIRYANTNVSTNSYGTFELKTLVGNNNIVVIHIMSADYRYLVVNQGTQGRVYAASGTTLGALAASTSGISIVAFYYET